MAAGSKENENREAQLEALSIQLQDLTESPYYNFRIQNGYRPVFGEGDPGASILFVGEAPGEQEAKSGRPFVGAAGKVLEELLNSIGLERRNIYITNIVKDRPPQNQNPTQKAIRLYAPILLRQIEIIQPKVIVPLGRFALNFIMENFQVEAKGKISELHGLPLQGQASYGEVAILPLYHPAASFYNRELKQTLENDFQSLKKFL